MSDQDKEVTTRTQVVQKFKFSRIVRGSEQTRAKRGIQSAPLRRPPVPTRAGRRSRSGMSLGSTTLIGFVSLLPLLMTVGCAYQPRDSRQTQEISAQGPGTVFFSVEAAAYDALSYSYLQSRADHKPAHSMGGTIYSVAGGFSYTSPLRAKKFSPDEVVYPLRPEDVGHYHTYPRHWDRRVNVIREKFSRFDRSVVNSIDPLRRPSFILTPKLKVKVYRGDPVGTLFVAKLGEWSDVMNLARSAPGPITSPPQKKFVSRIPSQEPVEARGALSGH